MIFDKRATIYKLQNDSLDSDKEDYQVLYQNVPVNIQPEAFEFEAAVGDGSIGKRFRLFTSQSGISETMLVVTSGSTTYSGYKYEVIGVEDWSSPSYIPHFEASILKNDK